MLRKFGDIVDEQMKSLGYETTTKEWSAVWLWSRIVGESLAAVSRADRVRGHVLYVSVKSSSWAHHLSIMKRQFLVKINDTLGEDVLKDIKFTVTHYSQELSYREGLSKWETVPGTATDFSKIDLSDDVMSEIKETASVIRDGRLRMLFEKTQLADRKRKEDVARRNGNKCRVCGVPLESSDVCPVCANSVTP